MNAEPIRQPTRRAVLVCAILAGLWAMPVPGQESEELNPSDLVPRRISAQEFARLSPAELYKVNLALRRGRRILIDGHSASRSRAMIEAAARDPAAPRPQR